MAITMAIKAVIIASLLCAAGVAVHATSKREAGKDSAEEQIQGAIREALLAVPEVQNELRGATPEVSLLLSSVLPKCDGVCRYDVALPRNQRLFGRLTVGILAASATETRKSYVQVMVDAPTSVLKLKVALRKGELFNESNLEATPARLSALRGTYFTHPAEIVGQAAKNGIAAGSIVSGDMIKKPALAKRGTAVDMTVRTGMVTITCKGVLLEDGYQDDPVQVQNTDSKRVVFGKLVSSQRVVVDL